MHENVDETGLDPEEQLRREWALFRSVENGSSGNLSRCWQVSQPVVVVGRSSAIDADVNRATCIEDGVCVLRRFSGGGAVVLGPGCLNYAVVLSLASYPELANVSASFQIILGRIVGALGVPGLAPAGATDLVLGGRKVSGNAQRRGRRALIHHGTLLCGFDPRLAARYLTEPVRQPAYRAARHHTEFMGNLPLSVETVRARLKGVWTDAASQIDQWEVVSGAMDVERRGLAARTIHTDNGACFHRPPYSPAEARRARLCRPRFLIASGLALAAFMSPVSSIAQTATPPQTQSPGAAQDDPLRFVMPTVTVTAQKEPEDKQKLPLSVTAVPSTTIENAGIHIVSDAAIFAPNTYFTEWTARKLSNARFRGIGSSPNNPAITTYIDGVPQFNANSSSIELLDVDQLEFVRGPQSALFGRNTLGGLVNIASSRPSLPKWTGTLSVPFGNHGSWAVRGGASGPVVGDKVSLGVSFAQVNREGFTVNDVTGNDIDRRDAFSAKAQVLWIPNSAWEARVIFTGERARDGDYGLNDVAALRANPFHAARDFEGHVDRDVLGTTIQARRVGGPIVFSSTTGFLNWNTQDVTDLDYTPSPILTRDNTEKDFQFTEEVRFASADNRPVQLSDRVRLRWQTGVSLFTQAYQQDAINTYAPFLFAPFPVSQHTPLSTLDDFGFGVFGQGTVTFNERLDLTAGARLDYEDKSATLQDFYAPPILPGTSVDADRSFSNVSPQVAVAYRLQPDKTLYATAGSGYKAGGFNSASPAGSAAYGEERTWHFEGGVKTLWANSRLSTNAAVFYINWDDLQLNVPNPAVPTQFYISNIGGAVSKGIEVEVNARPAPGVDVFTAIGYTHARFGAGSVSGSTNVEGNSIPSTPDYTASAGLQYSRMVGPATVHGRADVVFYGAFKYTDANTLGQEAYSLVNLRFGMSGRLLTGEVFVRNAFDTRYIPLAFPYPNFAPSGFMGEMGTPRTAGVSIGVRF